MPKYNSIEEYKQTFTAEALAMYETLKKLILSLDDRIKERLFAGQIAFYMDETLKRTFHESPVIVLSFFKDHVNIFAHQNETFKSVLHEYTFTEKNTLQIKYNDSINQTYLPKLLMDSLS